MMKFLDKLKKPEKIFLIILIVLTLLRIFLAQNIPLFLQGDASYDDMLLVNYGKSMLSFDWLGSFSDVTLAKSVSFSLFLVITRLFSIPYSFALILAYILAIFLLVKALSKFIKNRYFGYILYLFLLYSPIMFHEENSIKVYRGGLIICCTILVIAAFIGLLYSIKNKKISWKWLLLASLSLPFFYYLKEDSIWIMPFVLGMIIYMIILVIKNKIHIFKNIFKIIIPLLSLFIVTTVYKTINYVTYGEFAITDRGDTYFKDFAHDLIIIDDPNANEYAWITKDMINKALDNSKSFNEVRPYIDKIYEISWAKDPNTGEINGDIIYWLLKDALAKAGKYTSGKDINNYYKNIHDELTTAFNNGDINKAQGKIYISKIAYGKSLKDIITYYKNITPEVLKMLITYNQNVIEYHVSSGTDENILLMQNMTNSYILYPNKPQPMLGMANVSIKTANNISLVYTKVSKYIFIISIVGLILMIIFSIIKKCFKYKEVYIIIILLILAGLALIFGVEWFGSFFIGNQMRKFYDYLGGAIPIIQIIEMIGVYFIFHIIGELYEKRKIK